MNISFIVPCSNITHYGVRSISSFLKSGGHNVDLIFVVIERNDFEGELSREALEQIIDAVKCSDLVGISVMTNFLKYAKQITKVLRKETMCPIMWGGIHPTSDPENCMNYVDMVCRGEGEEAILQLVERWETQQYFGDVKNFWIGKIQNEVRNLCDNLDDYPDPDFDLSHQYILKENSLVKMTSELLKQNLIKMGKRSRYPVFTTRGCPNSCTYCCNNVLHRLYEGKGTLVRKRSIDRVLGELKRNVNKFGFESVCIQDENFLVRKTKEIIEFCDRYKKEIHLPFQCEFSPALFDEEKINFLVDAGLCRVQIGIQSINSETNIEYKRKSTREQIDRTVNFFKKHPEIICNLHFLVHNTWETEESLIESILFISELPSNFNIKIYPLILFPKTEMYDRAEKEKILGDYYDDIVYKDWSLDRIEDSNYLGLVFYIINFLRKQRYSLNVTKFVARYLTFKPIRKIHEIPLLFELFKSWFCKVHNLRGEGRV
jgi:radical SAM superfamily enzyme YgiQ (UPF0313 family)